MTYVCWPRVGFVGMALPHGRLEAFHSVAFAYSLLWPQGGLGGLAFIFLRSLARSRSVSLCVAEYGDGD